jgi:septum formation topological specificity factor MinE
MEIKQRISTCLSALEEKRQAVDTFQARLKRLIDTLRAEGMTPGTLSDLLQMLESVLKDYSEISQSCLQMVEELREIGNHLSRIEDGRQKILTGVEAILQNLSHLDRLAKNGMQLGTASGKSPKRILLVRISPGETPPGRADQDDEDESPAGDTVVH